MNGYIVKGIGGFYYVKTPDGIVECKARGIFRKRGITPVAGSMGSWPDVMIRLPAWMPCEYGPMAAGAFSVEMTVFINCPHLLIMIRVYHFAIQLSI